jgi:GDP-4-dehydro-6-deoxy-D-mannose reductase
MKALVTGAAGFVGRHLVALLHAEGDEVVALDQSATPGDAGAPLDVTDAEAVARAVDAAAPDVVFHLAARSHVGDSWGDDDELDRVNVGGTRAVVDACRETAVARVVVVGSAEQYGAVPPDHSPIGEDTVQAPLSPYGRSKRDAEVVALGAWRDDGVPVVCVRAFNHTGPGQSPAFFVPGFASRIAAAEHGSDDEIDVGNLESVRDFTDVRDVVRAYRLLAHHGTAGEAYNVCSGEGVRVAELAARLLARADRPLRMRVDPDLVRPVEVPVFVGDPTKLMARTGWSRTFPLDRTLDDVLAAARAAERGEGD